MNLILKYFLVCSLVFNTAIIEEISSSNSSALLPAMKELPREELKPLIEKLDEAIDGKLIEEKHKVLLQIAHYITEENTRFRGCYMLCYNNPEIKSRVADLYIKECSIPLKTEPGPTNPWYFGEGEYQELFMSLAESTFDPNIYDYVLDPPEYFSELRYLYLATVNPVRTLNYILDSPLGQRNNKTINPDVFYNSKISNNWAMTLEDACFVLSLMCVRSPEILINNRESVMSFVKQHVKHYSSARKVDWKTEPVYFTVPDYDVRNGALDIIKLLGTEKDIKLIEVIIKDAPILDSSLLNGGPKNRIEQIKQKGEKLIKLLQNKNQLIYK